MVYSFGKYIVHLDREVIKQLSAFRQVGRDQHEQGGVLLGHVFGDHIQVLRISIPNGFDNSGRFYFHRDKRAAQIVIDHEFHSSGGKMIYLGEWHTHPEKHPTPSNTDEKMIADQLRLGKLNEPFLLMLIQGQESIYLSMQTKKGSTAGSLLTSRP